jgi:hypothetical protein
MASDIAFRFPVRTSVRSPRDLFRWLALACALSAGAAFAADDCDRPLFSCQTDRPGKSVSLCATEKEDGSGWKDVQYRFGRDGEKPELVYPQDPARGAELMYFSHTLQGGQYRVRVRFESGGYRYRVYSNGREGGGSAGVEVFDARNQRVSHIRCTERPSLFSTYLRTTLACDTSAARDGSACREEPLRAGPQGAGFHHRSP